MSGKGSHSHYNMSKSVKRMLMNYTGNKLATMKELMIDAEQTAKRYSGTLTSALATSDSKEKKSKGRNQATSLIDE